jgi:hypothetical protein
VKAFGDRDVTDFVYADDIAILAENRQQLEAALRIVGDWASAWGFRIGLGRKKTEYMVFGPSGREWARDTTPIGGGDARVSHTDEYRYLGCPLRADLSYDSLRKRYATMIAAKFARFFRANDIVERMTLRAQIIHYRTFVTSSANFLAAALPVNDWGAVKELDRCILPVLKKLLCLPGNGTNSALWQESRIPSCFSTWVRERYRVFLEAAHPLSADPSRLLHHIVRSQLEDYERGSRVGWTAETLNMIDMLGWDYEIGAPWPTRTLEQAGGFRPSVAPPTRRYNIRRCAANLGRIAGMHYWITEAMRSAKRSAGRDRRETAKALAAATAAGAPAAPPRALGLLPPEPRTLDLPWRWEMWWQRPPALPTHATMWLHGGYYILEHTAGVFRSCTPLSMVSPGCSGCIVSNSKVERHLAERVLHMRTGRMAFITNSEKGTRHTRYCEAGSCKDLERTDDAWHHAFECPSNGDLTDRLHAIGDGIVADLCRAADEMRKRVAPAIAPREATISRVRAAAGREGRWQTATGRAALYRLVLAQPWGACQVDPTTPGRGMEPSGRDTHPSGAGQGVDPGAALAIALGYLFNTIRLPPFMTQRLCSCWTSKAAAACRLIHETRIASGNAVPLRLRGADRTETEAKEEEERKDEEEVDSSEDEEEEEEDSDLLGAIDAGPLAAPWAALTVTATDRWGDSGYVRIPLSGWRPTRRGRKVDDDPDYTPGPLDGYDLMD